MEEPFDPYRKWLGIPPEEQPPNHYRLLGIALYETDPDVISNAADRQMAHVRTYQTGKRAPLSQALLNELSSAKICLLNPASKQQYDNQLLAWQSQLPRAVALPTEQTPHSVVPPAIPVAGIPTGISIAEPDETGDEAMPTIRTGKKKQKIVFPGADEPRPTAVRPAAAQPVAVQPVAVKSASAPIAVGTPVAGAAEVDAPIPVEMRGTSTRVVRRSSSSAAITGIIGVGMAALLIVVVAMIFGGGDDSSTSETNRERPGVKEKPKTPRNSPSSPAPNAVPIVNHPTNERPPIPPKPTTPPEKVPGETDENPEEKPANDAVVADDPPEKNPPEPQVPEAPAVEDEPSNAATAKRLAPPAAEAVSKAYRILRKELEPQLRAAVAPEERHELVAQIVERAAKEAEPANQYALYMIAHNLGVQLASADTACDVIDLVAARYHVRAFEMKRAAIEQIANFETLGVEDYEHILRLLQRLAREAMATEMSDAAVALSRLAKGTSTKVRSPKAIKEFPALEDLLSDVDRLAIEVAEFDREVKAFDRNAKLLEKEPNNAAANLSVGRYWLLVKGDWVKALPHLAKSADPTVKDPAIRDLAGPKSAAEQEALADTWASLAPRKGGLHAPRLLERAKHWYAQAAQTAADAEKLLIEAKIAELDVQLKSVVKPVAPAADEANATEPEKTTEEAFPEPGAKESEPAKPAPASPADDDAPVFPD